MKKKDIKKQVVELQEEAIRDLKDLLQEYGVVADIDENATKDPEDLSRQDEANEMIFNLKEQLQRAKFEMSILEKLPEKSTDEVALGALVETTKDTFYVSISTTRNLASGDTEVICISTDSPLYKIIEGKKAGHSFSLNGRNYTINSVQ